MNFYEHMCDICIFNQRGQINYTIEYICFLGPYKQPEDKRILDCIWQN